MVTAQQQRILSVEQRRRLRLQTSEMRLKDVGMNPTHDIKD